MSEPSRLDLFGESVPADPLLDLVVTLPDVCKCGAAESVIGPGRGPHLASLSCCTCKAFRGWVGHQTHAFLTKIVAQHGRPVEAVAIRRARDLGFVSSPDLRILPPRGGETADHAPPVVDTVNEAESNTNGDGK